jgi:hypothetical protein
VVKLPGVSTEPNQHQMQNATKSLRICGDSFKGAILADTMGLGKYLTVAITVMLSGKTHGPRGAPALMVTMVSCMD